MPSEQNDDFVPVFLLFRTCFSSYIKKKDIDALLRTDGIFNFPKQKNCIK